MDEKVKMRVLKMIASKMLQPVIDFQSYEIATMFPILRNTSDPSSFIFYDTYTFLTVEQTQELIDLTEQQYSHAFGGKTALQKLIDWNWLDPLSNFRFIASLELATTYKILRNETDPESYIYYPSFYDLSEGQLDEMITVGGFTLEQFIGWGWIEQYFGYRWIAPDAYKDRFPASREDGVPKSGMIMDTC